MCKCPLFYGVTVIADGTFSPSNLLVLTLEMCSLLGNYSLLLGKIKSGQSSFSPLFKKSPIQEMSKFVNPRAGKSHPALPSGDSSSRCHSVVAMVMPTATSVTAVRAAAVPYPQAHLSGMWTPSQVLFWHFLHFVEPLPQSHEVEIISCLFRQRSSLKPQPTSPVLSSTPAGCTHNEVVIYVTGVPHVLCQPRLHCLKASLAHLHLYTLLHCPPERATPQPLP